MALLRRLVPFALVALFLAALFVPNATANPTVPYCLGSVSPSPIAPMVIQPAVCEAATGRVFPEAFPHEEYAAAGYTGYASDYVAFPEFEAGIRYLDQNYGDWMEIIKLADSYGLSNGQSVDHFPIYVIKVTNEKSAMPSEKKLDLLFMLSIHGVEKGGREGGMRTIEDFVKNIGVATEKLQDGAGMPAPLAMPGGKTAETYHDLLDIMNLYFLFPNADGWMHDELPYVASGGACGGNGVLMCRTNGNGTDLNRQMPTIGWQLENANSGRRAMMEPEARGYAPWLSSKEHHWAYAIDIHGQLNHPNYVPVMMPAGSFTPQEMARSTRLAETLKERLNADPHFSRWTTACDGADTASNGASTQACSGTFAEWSTVWDAIGYTDSGFSGDFFAQTTGMNAPGYDIEMSYNHMTFDSQYEAGAMFNDYHVKVVREVVKSFMDAAALDVQVAYETNGHKTLYVESSYVATNLDDEKVTPGGWADINAGDDVWQYTAEKPFRARPAKYWSDMQAFVKDGDKPGVLTGVTGAGLTKDLLAQYDTLVIPGSAINSFVQGTWKYNEVANGTVDTAKIQMIYEWVQKGGNLILTDGGLKFFDLAGITKDGVHSYLGYAGAIDLDRAHELNKDVRGAARQTYEPVPLGFAVGQHSPIWSVSKNQFTAAGGDVAGIGYLGGDSDATADDVSLGQLKLGDGRIRFIGALLPDPTEEFYHPYGLDDYAPTYSGNQILRNMLGWDQVFAAPVVVINDSGDIVTSDSEPDTVDASMAPSVDAGGADNGTPGFEAGLLVLAVVGMAVALRRRNA